LGIRGRDRKLTPFLPPLQAPSTAAPLRALPCSLPYTPPTAQAAITDEAGLAPGDAAAAPAPALTLRRLGPKPDTPLLEEGQGTAPGWAPPDHGASEHAHLSALAAIAFDAWLEGEGNTTACGPATVPAVGVTIQRACVKCATCERTRYALEFRARFSCGAVTPGDVAVSATLRAVLSAASLEVANSDAPHGAPRVEGVWLAGGYEEGTSLIARTTRRALLPAAGAPVAPAAPGPGLAADRVVFDGPAAVAGVEARAEAEAEAAARVEGKRAFAAAAAALAQQLSSSTASASVADADDASALGINWATVEEQSGMKAGMAAAGEGGWEEAQAQAGEAAADPASPPAGGPADAAFDAAVASEPASYDFGASPAADTAEGMASAFDAEQAAAAAEAAEAAEAEAAALQAAEDKGASAAAVAAEIVASGDTPAALAASDEVLDAAAAASLGSDLSEADLVAVGVDPADRTRFWAAKGQRVSR